MDTENKTDDDGVWIECKPESPLKGRKLEPKYRDPETGKTWAGRGKLPKFLQGKDKEHYRI